MPSDADAAALAGKRALVLEDEPVIGFAIEDMLEALGCAVAGIAHRVEDALSLLGTRRFDVAVLDVNVAGEPGYPVADALFALGVPFVFATGYGDAGRPDRFAAVPTLAKPYGIDGLGRALGEALRRAGAPPVAAPSPVRTGTDD